MDNIGEVAVKVDSSSNLVLSQGFEQGDFTLSPVVLPISPPNAFSPDGDGTNDTWIVPLNEQYEQNSVVIFNRWGEIIRQFENYNKKFAYNSIRFENVNINLYDKNKNVASLSNCNLALIKNKEVVYINDLFIDSLVVKDFNTKNNFILNDLKLIKKNQSSYTFKINNIEIPSTPTL